MERLSLGWDTGLRLLAGYGGVSKRGGRVLWSQKPGAAQEFWLALHFLGPGGRDPREATTDKRLHSVAP